MFSSFVECSKYFFEMPSDDHVTKIKMHRRERREYDISKKTIFRPSPRIKDPLSKYFAYS